MSKNAKVTKVYSDLVGRPVNYEIREVTKHDDEKQYQLVNVDTHSIVLAKNTDSEAKAVDAFVDAAGSELVLDAAWSQQEIDGPQGVVNVDNKNTERFGSQTAPVDNVIPEDSAEVVDARTAEAEQSEKQAKADEKAKADKKTADDKKAKKDAADAQRVADEAAKKRQEDTNAGSNSTQVKAQ